jgi:hypothetical protein
VTVTLAARARPLESVMTPSVITVSPMVKSVVASIVPEPTIAPANVEDKSSLIVSAVARAFRELPDPPALAVLNTMSPPAPEPLPCPPCIVKAPPAMLLVVPAVVAPAPIDTAVPAASWAVATGITTPASTVIVPSSKITEPLAGSKLIAAPESSVNAPAEFISTVPSAVISIFPAAAAASVVTIESVPFVPAVKTTVRSTCPIIYNKEVSICYRGGCGHVLNIELENATRIG